MLTLSDWTLNWYQIFGCFALFKYTGIKKFSWGRISMRIRIHYLTNSKVIICTRRIRIFFLLSHIPTPTKTTTTTTTATHGIAVVSRVQLQVRVIQQLLALITPCRWSCLLHCCSGISSSSCCSSGDNLFRLCGPWCCSRCCFCQASSLALM